MGRRRRTGKKIDYDKLTPLQVYDCLLSRDLLKFPNTFVTPENMKKIIREVILNKQKLSRQEICEKLSYDYLKDLKLGGSRRAFDDNIFQLITYCFPEMNIKYWELKRVEAGFWSKEENRREYMLWLAEKEKIDLANIGDLKKIDARLINANHGSKALKFGGVYGLILLVAMVEVKEWQVIKMSAWNKEKAIAAIKWLIEEKLKWSHDEVVEKINARIFYANDLGGMLCKFCDNSPLKALQIAYPGEYHKLKNIKPEYLRKK